ncbi:hypothetical protein [Curvibacter gracilis]|uniref:hypothetical protein n=1 Tax=Curvibacter gracilis TaxID=230310 RepID=UPI0012FA4256|nr:hypothetical protein [Curvibacter gracilis]
MRSRIRQKRCFMKTRDEELKGAGPLHGTAFGGRLPRLGLLASATVLAAVLSACGGGSTASVDPLAPAEQSDLAKAPDLYGIDSSGVGGDGGGDGGAAGGAGDGAPLGRATVTLTDSQGNTVSGTTDANGKFLLKYKTSVFKPPMVLRVVDAGGNVLASATDESAATGKVHRISVNPLTDKITSDILQGAVTGTDKAYDGSKLDASKLASAKANLLASVSTALQTAGFGDTSKFDAVKSVYAYDGNGVDAVIESISHTRDPGTGVTQLRAKLTGIQNNADGTVVSNLITAATPLPSSAVALPSNPALTYSKLNAWVVELNRCLALAPAARAADANCINNTGERLVSNSFKNSSMDLAASYSNLFSNTDRSAVQGSTASNPVVLFTARSSGSNVDDIAVVELTINQPGTGPLAGSSTTPISYTSTFVFRRDDNLTRAVAGNWILKGNQRNFNWSIEPEYFRSTQANPARQANVNDGKNYPSFATAGLRLNFSGASFDPATATFKASGVYAVRLTGPGLPSGGVVWAPIDTTGTSVLRILNKTGTIPSPGTLTTVPQRDFRMGGVTLGGEPLAVWNGNLVYRADSPSGTDFSKIQMAAQYQAEIYVNGSSTPIIETARLTAPIQAPSLVTSTPMHDMSGNLAAVAPPRAASSTVTTQWVRVAGAPTIDSASTYYMYNSINKLIVASANVSDALSVKPTSTSVTISNGAAGFPAATTADYLELDIYGRLARAYYAQGYVYSP